MQQRCRLCSLRPGRAGSLSLHACLSTPSTLPAPFPKLAAVLMAAAPQHTPDPAESLHSVQATPTHQHPPGMLSTLCPAQSTITVDALTWGLLWPMLSRSPDPKRVAFYRTQFFSFTSYNTVRSLPPSLPQACKESLPACMQRLGRDCRAGCSASTPRVTAEAGWPWSAARNGARALLRFSWLCHSVTLRPFAAA